ncbi:hypothetical protein VTJ49DRAFT_5903 [Mycothermus thermophilus]|uniref:Uncharacterized protein n=1 Tax=Humicola insolens TaxID=85995 RepID=A0ABR3V2A0_HUMIN
MPSLPPQDFLFLPIPSAPPQPLNLTLKTSSSWTYCGPLLPLDSLDASDDASAALPTTFHTWTSHTIAGPSPSPRLLTALLPLLRSAHTFLRQQNIHHYWLTIRASRPTDEFDTPRWHTDDNFFTAPRRPDEDPNAEDVVGLWKLCATLQGQGTLFFAAGEKGRRALREAKLKARREQEAKPHVCTTVRCKACGATSDKVREEVAGVLAREQERVESGHGGKGGVVVQPRAGEEMVFFRVGGREGAVHSEPRHDVDRVFVNIIPGGEDELRVLMRRWGMEFPRSWSLGVPVTMPDALERRGGEEGVEKHATEAARLVTV